MRMKSGVLEQNWNERKIEIQFQRVEVKLGQRLVGVLSWSKN